VPHGKIGAEETMLQEAQRPTAQVGEAMFEKEETSEKCDVRPVDKYCTRGVAKLAVGVRLIGLI
jgi:hypothetical protein